MSLILEANIPQNRRACFYSLPLFLSWVPGILWEREEGPAAAASQGFLLVVLYLLFYGAAFFLRGFLSYLLGAENPVLAYLFFGIYSIASLLYIGLSLWNAWSLLQGKPSLPIVPLLSRKLESFLSR